MISLWRNFRSSRRSWCSNTTKISSKNIRRAQRLNLSMREESCQTSKKIESLLLPRGRIDLGCLASSSVTVMCQLVQLWTIWLTTTTSRIARKEIFLWRRTFYRNHSLKKGQMIRKRYWQPLTQSLNQVTKRLEATGWVTISIRSTWKMIRFQYLRKSWRRSFRCQSIKLLKIWNSWTVLSRNHGKATSSKLYALKSTRQLRILSKVDLIQTWTWKERLLFRKAILFLQSLSIWIFNQSTISESRRPKDQRVWKTLSSASLIWTPTR
jgi:hypothetical protein